jgi:hypothetical protein
MKIVFLPAALCALSFVLIAQKGDKTPPQEPPDKTRITLDVSRVSMLFTVSDKKHRFVTDLTKEDFEVIEGKKPQSIIEFTAETDLPLRLAILVDTSNSIRERFRFQQEAATAFIDGSVRPHQDKALVVSFDTATELVTDLTDDIGTLEKAVQGLRPGGGTAMYEAIFFACRALQVSPGHGHSQRRRRQPEPLHARSGPGNGPKGGCHHLRDLHQSLAHRDRWRQGVEVFCVRDRRSGFLSIRGFRFEPVL